MLKDKKRFKMSNLRESFKEKFLKDIPLEIDETFPTHISVEKMIEIVYEAANKIGVDCYPVLKHFQFTEDEIITHLQNISVPGTGIQKKSCRNPSSGAEKMGR